MRAVRKKLEQAYQMQPARVSARPSRCSASRSSTSPPSDEIDPPAKSAVTLLRLTAGGITFFLTVDGKHPARVAFAHRREVVNGYDREWASNTHHNRRPRTAYSLNRGDLTAGVPQHIAHELSGRSDAIGKNVQREPRWSRSPALGGQQFSCQVPA